MDQTALQRHRFSSEDWVDQACRECLRSSLPQLLEDLIGFGPRLAFLAGSAALGEAAGVVLGDRRVVLSDLDVGIVTEQPVPEGRHPADRTALSVKLGVGLYTVSDLGKQSPTLGLIDFRRHGLVLWGDGGLLERFPAVSPERIPSGEAVRLIGNRSRELLEAADSSSISALHRWGKLAVALSTADAVLEKRYETGWRKRLERIQNRSGSRAIDRLAEAWIPFLLRPAGETLPPRDLGLLREGLAELFGRGSMGGRPGRPDPAAAFLSIPTTSRERMREWRHLSRETGLGWALRSRFRSIPEYRRLGLAAAYWTFGPERPEPVWGGEVGAVPVSAGSAWTQCSARLWGHPLGIGTGVRSIVSEIVTGGEISEQNLVESGDTR